MACLVLHDVAAEPVEVFLLDAREGRQAEQLDPHALALERGDLDFAFVTVQVVGLAQFVHDVVLDRHARGAGVFEQDVAHDALVTQLQLDRADHRLTEAQQAALAVPQDVREALLLLGGGELAGAFHGRGHLDDVVVGLLGEATEAGTGGGEG